MTCKKRRRSSRRRLWPSFGDCATLQLLFVICCEEPFFMTLDLLNALTFLRDFSVLINFSISLLLHFYFHVFLNSPCVRLPRGFAPNIAKFTFALRPSMIGFGSLHARSALNLSPMITCTTKSSLFHQSSSQSSSNLQIHNRDFCSFVCQ